MSKITSTIFHRVTISETSKEEYKNYDGESERDYDYTSSDETKKGPKISAQQELNNLVRYSGLPKDGTEYPTSVSKSKNLLSKCMKEEYYRDREEE